MKATTMLSAMLAHWMLTFSRSGDELHLRTYDRKLDTDALYTCDPALGASAIIVRAYADYAAEYL